MLLAELRSQGNVDIKNSSMQKLLSHSPQMLSGLPPKT